ncbi:MAG: LUD domain-containing protein, partial [bacterium]
MKSRDSVLQKLRNSAPALNFPDLSDVQDQLIYRDHPEPVFKKLLQVFAERLVALKGEIYIVSDAAEAAEKLIDLLGSTVEGACLVQAGPLLNTVKQQNNKLTDYWDEMLNINSLRFAEYVVGISEADCLVARTGSIVL